MRCRFSVAAAATAFAVTAVGPGESSLDHALELDLDGISWALVALGAGLAGSIVAVALGRAAAHAPAGPRTAGA